MAAEDTYCLLPIYIELLTRNWHCSLHRSRKRRRRQQPPHSLYRGLRVRLQLAGDPLRTAGHLSALHIRQLAYNSDARIHSAFGGSPLAADACAKSML
eukprot:scaffold539_cov359-Prasinococcus_capsulatus_cf.AAC.12